MWTGFIIPPSEIEEVSSALLDFEHSRRLRLLSTHDSNCLVQLKIATDTPRLLGLAIQLWTIPAQVVQSDIAISATEASGCVERRQARPRVHGVPSLELGSGAVEGGARPARRRRRSSGVFGDAVLALGARAWRTSTVQSALARESNQAAAERRRRWPHWPPECSLIEEAISRKMVRSAGRTWCPPPSAGHRQWRPTVPPTR